MGALINMNVKQKHSSHLLKAQKEDSIAIKDVAVKIAP